MKLLGTFGRIAAAGGIFLLAALPIGVHASPISDGIDWLVANQDPSGLWGEDNGTPFRDAVVVADVLDKLGADEETVIRGQSAVASYPTRSSDYLARKIIAGYSGGFGSLAWADSLVNMQNNDGAWGYQKGYGSNILETALAVRALWLADYPDTDPVNIAGGYLHFYQNPDGGWGFVPGDSSRVYYTALVVLTFTLLEGEYAVGADIDEAVAWLLTQANGDNGFGSGGISNPYETALAVMAILKRDQSSPVITNALSYLEGTQLPNGSWDDDPYSTAMAIHALSYMAADLSILASEITLSQPFVLEYDVVTVSAQIRNIGLASAADILVQFFDGDPMYGGVQIGSDTTFSSLNSGDSEVAQVEWNSTGLAGDHDFYVVIDPLDAISEPDIANNINSLSVHVYVPPDFEILHTDITFDPPQPEVTDTVHIFITVHNLGEVTAVDIPLQVYNGDPNAGGIPLLAPYIIAAILPGSQFTLDLFAGTYFGTVGDYDIHACADDGDLFFEGDELNNCNYRTLQVGLATASLTIYPGLNLLGLPLEPIETPTAFEILPLIPNGTELHGWDRELQQWTSAVDIGGTIIGEDFPITTRDGFFARASSSGAANFRGHGMTAHVGTRLEPGYNLISIPNTNACYTGYSLMLDILDCTEGYNWDPALQDWELAELSGGTPTGEDFPVVPGLGYAVMVDTPGDWMTHTCDTIPPPKLPDLRVEAVDLILDPNPGPSSASFGIYLNVHNDGDTTAFGPMVSFFNGDPYSGGSHLRSAYWADIPVGGESGYMGWGDFSFPVPDAYEIYAVVDYNNVIEELNETNNQTNGTLLVTAAEIASGIPDPVYKDMGVTISTPTALDETAVTGIAGINPALLASVETVDESFTEFARVPTEDIGLAASASGTPVSLIFGTMAGNHTNAAVTVSWVTDVPGDGRVNYGIASVAEFAAYQSGYDDELHYVQLNNLQTNTTYMFEVVSGAVTDDNGGLYYTFTTADMWVDAPAIIHGTVLDEYGAPAPAVIAAVTVRHSSTDAHPLVALTDVDGRWKVNLGNLWNPIIGTGVAYDVGDSVFVDVQGGPLGIGRDLIAVSGTSPQFAGTIQLSQCDCSNFCDLNDDAVLNAVDVVYQINYVYKNLDGRIQIATCPGDNGDWDCDGIINAIDVVYSINYVYKNQGSPCDPCACEPYPSNCP